MRRLLRVLVRAWLVVAGLLSIAYTVAYFNFNDATLGEFITRRVSTVERGSFILKRARYPYLGGLVSMLFGTSAHAVGEDFTLLDPDGNAVIRVPVAYADVRLQELVLSLVKTALTGGKRFYLTLHFPRATIPSGWAVIAPTASTWGLDKTETNIVAAMSAKKRSEPSGGATVIRVDEVELGRVDFAMGFSSPGGLPAWWAKLDGATAKARLTYSSARHLATADGPYFFFRLYDVDAEKAALQLGDYHFPLEGLHADEFGVRAKVRQELYFVARAHTLGARVDASGALTAAYSEHPGVRLFLDVEHGRGPLALLPPPLSTWLSGDPSGRVVIDGPFSHPVLDGDIRHIDANLSGLYFSDGTAKLHFDGGRLRLSPATGHFAHGEARANVDLDLRFPGRWSALLAVHGVDPALVPSLPRSVGSELAGKLDAKVRLTGSLYLHPERVGIERLSGELVRSGKGGHLPAKITVAGDGEYTPLKLALDKVTASGDGVSTTFDGAVEPRSGKLDAAVKLDARGSSPMLGRLGVPPGLAFDNVRAEGRISGALRRPQLALHAVATHVTWSRRTLDRLEADLSLRGGTVVVSDLSGSGLGATFAGSGTLDLFQSDLSRVLAEPSLRAQLSAHGLSVAALTGWLGVQGHADVDVELSGALTHPHGRASLTLPRLEVQGDVYSGGALRLAFSDEGARVQELSLARARGGSVKGSGKIGWDGELDLRLLPRDFPLSAIPWLKSVPVPLAGTLSGDVTVGGTLDRPVPGGVVALVGFAVREALLGRGELKLEPGADAIHVSGKFFGNVSVDGYITLSPKFSVVCTIRFLDLALERFYPEILELAEVRTLASGSVSFTVDSDSGLTFARLILDKLTMTLSSNDESGHLTKLVVRNQDPVLATTDLRTLELKQANFYSALGEFTMRGTVGRVNNVYMRGHIGLELLEYFFRGLFEHTHGPADLELSISGDILRPDVTGYIKIGGGKGPAELIPHGLEGRLRLIVPSGRIQVTPQKVQLTEVVLSTDRGRSAQASGEVELNHWTPGAISATLVGDISPKLLQWRWQDQLADASGTIKVNVKVGGVFSHPEWHGSAVVEDVLVRARKLERDLRISGGTIVFDNYDVAIGCPRKGAKPPGCRSLYGLIDEDSKVTRLDGRVSFGDELALKHVDLWVDGRELRYAQPGWAVSFSPQVELIGDGGELLLRGDINLVEGRYSQNFDLVGMIFQPRTAEAQGPFWQGFPLLETMRLGLHVESTGALVVKNNIADLPLRASLDISGTLSEPAFDGLVTLEEGGRISPPGFRYSFDTDQGSVRFAPDKKIPTETPVIDLSATAAYVDKNEQQHTLIAKLYGTALSPRLDLGSLDGWDRNQVLVILIGGQSPEEVRRITQGSTGAVATSTQTSATDNIAKTVTGATLGQVISDPLRRQIGLDVVNVQFGGSSFQLDACKRLGRQFKACGQGEIGFAGSSRFGGSLELRVSDRPFELGGVGRVEYLTRGVETLQDSLTSGRGELKLRIPLGY